MNKNRYIRQTNLPQIGEKGQHKLAEANVLVIGAGGLGCAVLPYLAGAGVGTLGIVDGDVVALNNLHRQVLFNEGSIGKLKVDEAKKAISLLNSTLEIKVYPEFLSGKNALEIFNGYDIIVDASDTLAARYLINDACVLLNKPFVYASVYRFEVQVSVFNYGNGPTYRCLFNDRGGVAQNCEDVGVLGPTVGFAGMLQANEVLKIITGIGEVLSGKLLFYNVLNNRQDIFHFEKDKSIKVDYQFYQRIHLSEEIEEVVFSGVNSENLLYVDVREAHEQPKISLNNLLEIPLSVLNEKLYILPKNKELLLFCQSGKRSLQAAKLLKTHGFQQVKSIKGGIVDMKNIIT